MSTKQHLFTDLYPVQLTVLSCSCYSKLCFGFVCYCPWWRFVHSLETSVYFMLVCYHAVLCFVCFLSLLVPVHFSQVVHTYGYHFIVWYFCLKYDLGLLYIITHIVMFSKLKGTYRDHMVTGALNVHKIRDFFILVMVLDTACSTKKTPYMINRQ